MTLSKLRIVIYLSWVASLLISTFMLLLGPAVRGDETLGYDQVFSVIPAVIGLHQSESFAARINDAVKIGLMLSPVALAPAAYLTRLVPARK